MNKMDFFLKRTAEHIGRVKSNARYLAENIKDKRVSHALIMHVQSHDDSKFKDPEVNAYIEITDQYRAKKENREIEISDELLDMMNEATLHHINSNKHHPEYWCNSVCSDSINRNDRDAIPDKPVDGTNMPDESIAEMCCDWCSMSQELNNSNSAHRWADDNVNKRWLFSKKQVETIYNYLDILNKQ